MDSRLNRGSDVCVILSRVRVSGDPLFSPWGTAPFWGLGKSWVHINQANVGTLSVTPNRGGGGAFPRSMRRGLTDCLPRRVGMCRSRCNCNSSRSRIRITHYYCRWFPTLRPLCASACLVRDDPFCVKDAYWASKRPECPWSCVHDAGMLVTTRDRHEGTGLPPRV